MAQRHALISYVRENSEVIDRLTKELRDGGVPVWLDRDDIEPGIPWKDAIKNAIQRGEFFIACFSKEANEREKTHMREEINVAIDELRLRPYDKSWFIPVIVNESVIPPQRIISVLDISDLQAVKLYDDWDAELRKLLRTMKRDDP